MPAAIPLVIAGISAASSAYAAHRQAAAQRDAQQLAQQQGEQQSALSRTLSGYAQDQYALSRPAQERAIGLYSRLTNGDRAAVQGAIAPAVGTINENYSGAQRYLEQQGIRGGARDSAISELNRQKTGAVGQLPMQARMGAAGALASLGTQGTAAAMSGLAGAGGVAGGAGATFLGLAGEQRAQGDRVAEFGSNLTSTLLPYLTSLRRPQSQGMGVLSSSQTTPNYTSYMPGGSGY